MLAPIERVLDGDEERRESAARGRARAAKVGVRLPLVHRTCKPVDATASGSAWHDILNRRVIAAGRACTKREEAAGVARAAYFFLGCGAYPDGLVGFVLDAASVLAGASSYTPFDSGSLEKYAAPAAAMAGVAPWDDDAKAQFLANHLGHGGDALAFSGTYIAAHFRDPLEYVRRGQCSSTEFSVYHTLRDTSGDRRAWTIEAQVHEDVPLGRGGARIDEVVVGRAALLEDLPDDLVGLARVAAAENDVLESIAEGIETRIAAEGV